MFAKALGVPELSFVSYTALIQGLHNNTGIAFHRIDSYLRWVEGGGAVSENAQCTE